RRVIRSTFVRRHSFLPQRSYCHGGNPISTWKTTDQEMSPFRISFPDLHSWCTRRWLPAASASVPRFAGFTTESRPHVAASLTPCAPDIFLSVVRRLPLILAWR